MIILLVLVIWKLLGSKRSVIKITSTIPLEEDESKLKQSDSSSKTTKTNLPIPTPSSKHLKFAPTQVKKTSAKIKFTSGIIQEVFISTSIRNSKLEGDKLWESVEIDSFEIPIGGLIELTYEKQSKGLTKDNTIIRRGEGDDCTKGVCEGIETVKLKQDVLVGLEQMKVAAQSETLIMSIPSSQSIPLNSVTLVTQFTLSRLPRFERILKEWDGPISISIYLTDHEDIDKLIEYLKEDEETKLKEWNSKILALTIFKPDYTISEKALQLRLRYPINQLRNLALNLAPSNFVLVIDVDFVPSPNMHSILKLNAVPLILNPTTSNKKYQSPTFKPTAIVISAFILSPSFSTLNQSYPINSSSLQSLLLASPPYATLTDSNSGHGPSLPSLLFSSTLINSYEICFEPQWEPYYLLHKASHPLYDERFTDQGGDKQSHSLLLNLLGFNFRVLRNVWVLHPFKIKNSNEEDWPSTRLIDHLIKLEADGEREGEGKGEGVKLEGKIDSNHFSIGQREFNRFKYFQNYLPELEFIWGKNFRFPIGCSRDLVIGWRNFGRSQSGVVFGI